MKNISVDVAVIGAGSAGLRAFREARKWTDSAVLIEGGVHGTTCARVGCMPSKLLIAAAETAQVVREASAFGISADGYRIDGSAVMGRVRRERDRFVGFVVEGVEQIADAQRLTGEAQFVNDNRLSVGDDTIVEAKAIVIATGSTSDVLPFLADLGDRLVVNDDIFAWESLPKSVAVFGPGIIGLELGQALKRLGVDVIMFGRGGPVGPFTDPAVLAEARSVFERKFYLDADADVRSVRRLADGVGIEYLSPSGDVRQCTVEFVLAATGRTPNVSRLGLENTSLPLDVAGVPIFDPATMQAADSHVFIAGDVNNDRALLHEAADEGTIAGRNAARYPKVKPGPRSTPLAIVFTEPQMAMVGSRYSELDPDRVAVGEISFRNQGRARIMLRNEGLLRVYAERSSGRFLGAEMLGPRAEHIGHLLAWSYQARLTIDDMLRMPYYHPVIEEGLRNALRDAANQL